MFLLSDFNIIFKKYNCKKKIPKIIYKYFSIIKIFFKLSTKLIIFYIAILPLNIWYFKFGNLLIKKFYKKYYTIC